MKHTILFAGMYMYDKGGRKRISGEKKTSNANNLKSCNAIF